MFSCITAHEFIVIEQNAVVGHSGEAPDSELFLYSGNVWDVKKDGGKMRH
jgi:hypothetical protein